MWRHNGCYWACALVAMVTVSVLLNLYAGAPAHSAATLDIYTTVVDQQDLNAFYNTTASCPGSAASIDNSALTGDTLTGPSTAYGFGAPWQSSTGLISAAYAHGADCNLSTGVCLKAKFGTNDRTFSVDTRGTLGPRTVTMDFSRPCTTCARPGNPTFFGNTSVTTEALLTVFLDTPYTSMAVCSSRACLEAEAAWARLWFADPGGDPLLSWRAEWGYLRVLRMDSRTWYILADGCDGSQVAHLYKLHNTQKKPSVSFQGSYLIPFFLAVVQQ